MRVKDYLVDEKTGLPESFAPDEVDEKTDAVFRHLIVASRNESLFQ